MPATALGEFVGTIVLILLGNGVVAGVLLEKTKSNGAGWLVITAGWGFAVLGGVLVAVGLGAPGELNPAVTLANVIAGTRTVSDALVHVAAQMAGASECVKLFHCASEMSSEVLSGLPCHGVSSPVEPYMACPEMIRRRSRADRRAR